MSSERVSIVTILPPPPPPPPPLSPQPPPPPSSCNTGDEDLGHKTMVLPSSSSVLHGDEDLLNAKTKIWLENNIEEPPVVSFFRHIDPILQDGPICGLVALSMATSCMKQPISVEKLFDEARLRGFTSRGEMFSVDNMAMLAEETLKDCSVEILQKGLAHNKEHIIAMIANGSVLLLPYDADKNYSPCNLRGHKAHWAIILGVLQSTKTCHLIARHGKSRHLGIWSYEQLQSSNENLMELSPKAEKKSFVLPRGGVAMGLCGRAVLLHNLDS